MLKREGVSKHPKTHKALTFPSQGFAMSKSFCTFRQKFQTMTKVHFRPYITNQLILFRKESMKILRKMILFA